MSKHDECRRVGKFDCAADEIIHQATLDSGAGEGDVSSPVAWFEEITLGAATEADLIEHYGTRWLIARENSNGLFWVECYDTQEARDERLGKLREVWDNWAGAML